MSELEEKINKIINSLSKEELIELRNQLMNMFPCRVSNYVPSGDDEVIANYLDEFHYDEKRKEEVLKKYMSKEEFLTRY